MSAVCPRTPTHAPLGAPHGACSLPGEEVLPDLYSTFVQRPLLAATASKEGGGEQGGGSDGGGDGGGGDGGTDGDGADGGLGDG